MDPILMIEFFNKLDERIFLSIETLEYRKELSNLFSISFQIFTCFASFSVYILFLSSLYIRVFCLAFCTHFLFRFGRHSIVSNSSRGFIKSNRFDFINQVEEFETIEWGNPKLILSGFSNNFSAKYT